MGSLSESIKKIEEEEKVERAVRMAEAEIQRGEEKISGEAKPRKWFQAESEKVRKGRFRKRSFLTCVCRSFLMKKLLPV